MSPRVVWDHKYMCTYLPRPCMFHRLNTGYWNIRLYLENTMIYIS